jgi:alpha-glucoside transport system substrate-binding protein
MRMRTRRAVAMAMAATLVLAACGDTDDDDNDVAAPDDNGEEVDDDLAGTSVSVFGAPTSVEEAAIQNVIDETFNDPTGANATYEGSDDFENQIQIRAEGGNPPDVALFPQPGPLVEHAEQGFLVSLEDMGFDIDELRDQFGDYLLSLGEHDGQHYGIPTNVNYKSMVWYNAAVFEEEGYETPDTWDEMIELSEQMVEDGYTPWVIGTGSDAATGWPATDWMEDIMLRTAEPEQYDAWVAGELPFDSDEVRRAAELFAEIAFNEDFIVGSTANIPDLDFRDAPDALFADDGALMHRQASFVTSFFPSGTELGTDVDWFQFPEIDQQGALIAGEMAAIYDDRPEVRAFVESFTGQEAQCTMGHAGGPGHRRRRAADLAEHLEVGPDCYRDEVMQEASRQIVEALEAGTARFDASDLMPAAVGSGSFWDGMNEWMQGADLDTVLQEIDAAWPN